MYLHDRVLNALKKLDISYADVSASATFLRYISSDNFSEILFSLTLLPHHGLRAQESCLMAYGSDVVIMSSSIPVPKYFVWASRNIFRVSSGSVVSNPPT